MGKLPSLLFGGNRHKNKLDDVLDPIGLTHDTFVLNLATGGIRPNPRASQPDRAIARKTINRLKLNSAENIRMRARHYSEYLLHKQAALLCFYSPFVWYEANRQGVL